MTSPNCPALDAAQLGAALGDATGYSVRMDNDAIVMANFDFGAELDGHKYAIQISTAIPMDGGLSGSTLGEAVAWGKVKGDARRSMVYMEASVGLPLIYGYINNNEITSNRSRMNFQF